MLDQIGDQRGMDLTDEKYLYSSLSGVPIEIEE